MARLHIKNVARSFKDEVILSEMPSKNWEPSTVSAADLWMSGNHFAADHGDGTFTIGLAHGSKNNRGCHFFYPADHGSTRFHVQ